MSVSPLSELGFRIGLTTLCMAVGGRTTNLVGVKVFSAVFCAAGTVLVVGVRLRKVGRALTAKC